MWLFHCWKICGSLGIHKLSVLHEAEVTAWSLQAKHIWVSFMYIKYICLINLISNIIELRWCGRAGEASWQQLQRIAKLTHE